MDVDRTLEIAEQVAREAGQLLLQHSKRDLKVEAKSPGNYVTEADRKSQELIVEKLRHHFPESGFLAEEDDLCEKSPAQLTWVIDPLDGTNNFVHGFPHWSVSIGALWNKQLFLGIVHHPPLNELFSAGLGRGARLNGEKIQVSKIRRIPEALLATGFSYDTGESLRRSMKMFQTFQDNGQTIRRAGSAALDLANVAAGRFEGFWESGLKPWDCAAGLVLIQEAGGEITDFAGEPYQLGNPDLCVSNGQIHQEMLRRLKAFS